MAIFGEGQSVARTSQQQDPVKPVEKQLAIKPFVKESTPTPSEKIGGLGDVVILTNAVDQDKLANTTDTQFASLNSGEIAQSSLTVETLSPLTTTVEIEEAAPLMQVSGNRVNVRSGPSTANGVIARLVKGDPAQLVEDMGTGWSKIRFGETSRVGFMASRFLTATP